MQRYFSFRGRFNRAKYWAAVGIVMAYVVGALIFIVAAADAHTPTLVTGIVFAALVPGYFVCLWISLAATVKRLHDRNRSAWWLLVFYVSPSALRIAAAAMGYDLEQGIGILINLAGFCISIWGIVELGILKGTEGENPYGLDPLASGLALVFE